MCQNLSNCRHFKDRKNFLRKSSLTDSLEKCSKKQVFSLNVFVQENVMFIINEKEHQQD